MLEVVAELPMLALILHLEATPMHIGSRIRWLMLAGMIMRPRATSERTSSGGELLALGDIVHLFGDDALAGIMHLRANWIVLAFVYPLFSHVRIIPIWAPRGIANIKRANFSRHTQQSAEHSARAFARGCSTAQTNVRIICSSRTNPSPGPTATGRSIRAAS